MSNNIENMTKPEEINYADIFLKDALYTQYNVEWFSEDELLNILFHIKESYFANKLRTLDSYCTVCEKDTIFISKETEYASFREIASEIGDSYGGTAAIAVTLVDSLESLGTFQREFFCPRHENNAEHNQIFLFRVKDSKIIKIGQSPSMADLAQVEIQKYRKLDDNVYQELNRAIGLSTHGVGVGAFVYLRRIIEKHMVSPIIAEFLKEGKITDEELFQADFKKKIDLAKDRLPDFLVANKKIYSILSKGIHELSEDECRTLFPLLRTSIEIILDEEIETKAREVKNNFITKELGKFK